MCNIVVLSCRLPTIHCVLQFHTIPMKLSNKKNADVVKAVSLFEAMVSRVSAEKAKAQLKIVLQNPELREKVQREI